MVFLSYKTVYHCHIVLDQNGHAPSLCRHQRGHGHIIIFPLLRKSRTVSILGRDRHASFGGQSAKVRSSGECVCPAQARLSPVSWWQRQQLLLLLLLVAALLSNPCDIWWMWSHDFISVISFSGGPRLLRVLYLCVHNCCSQGSFVLRHVTRGRG